MRGLALLCTAGISFSALALIVSGQTSESVTEVEKNRERNVTAVINPKCPDKMCQNFTLVHVQQRGKTDTLHHIWTMERVPTLFYARTDLEAELIINWDALSANNSPVISFSKEPQYFAATIISKFIIFDDLADTGMVPDNSSQVALLDTRQMNWEIQPFSPTSNISASVTFRLVRYEGVTVGPYTNMQVVLTAYGTRARSTVLPHLGYTENSTQVDLILDHVESKHSFANARLAVELATVVSEPVNRFSFNTSRSLDDEYTPGVFKLMEVRSAQDQHWMQWRPVCYTSTKRDIADSTGVSQSQLGNVSDASRLLDDSLLAWLTLGTDLRAFSLQGLNVTFGVQGDGFYQASNYTAWTMVTGHGRPVGDEFSLMVILVMAVGLGLPAVVLFVGGLAIAIRNYRMGKDDLLLSN